MVLLTAALKQIIARAATDAGFRELLLADPERALAGYSLTLAEIAALNQLSRAEFDRLVRGEEPPDS